MMRFEQRVRLTPAELAAVAGKRARVRATLRPSHRYCLFEVIYTYPGRAQEIIYRLRSPRNDPAWAFLRRALAAANAAAAGAAAPASIGVAQYTWRGEAPEPWLQPGATRTFIRGEAAWVAAAAAARPAAGTTLAAATAAARPAAGAAPARIVAEAPASPARPAAGLG